MLDFINADDCRFSRLIEVRLRVVVVKCLGEKSFVSKLFGSQNFFCEKMIIGSKKFW